MEESLGQTQDLLTRIRRDFHCEGQDVRTYSPLTLAYIGDAVYDLIVRSVVVERANRPAGELHKKTVSYVRAETQAQMARVLAEEFDEEEAAVYRRGRNAKPYSTAKNASRSDYHKATGLEAVFGWLYLTDRTERLLELIQKGIAGIGMEL